MEINMIKANIQNLELVVERLWKDVRDMNQENEALYNSRLKEIERQQTNLDNKNRELYIEEQTLFD